MKKNFIFGLFAMATMMFTASCAEEELVPNSAGDTATVSFEVSTPTLATRAVGDGNTATKLYVGVYENQNGKHEGPLDVSLIDDGETVAFNNRVATVNLALAKNKEYSVIFWAETENNDDAMFNIDWATRELTLRETLKANQENYDAFWAQKTVNLNNGNISEEVKLTRPFAQLNIGTSDKAAAEAAGIEVENTQVLVKGVPTTFNLQTGAASGEYDVTYTMAAISDIKDEKFPAETTPVQSYLSLNYILMGNDKSTVDMVFSYEDKEDANPYTLDFASVPVQRNYRTNIYGTLLTNSANYTVEILPGFGENGEQDAANIVYVNSAEELASALTADKKDIAVRLLSDIELPISSLGQQTGGSGEYKLGSEKTQNITIDLGGKKLNVATTYWSVLGAKNADALFTIKNGTMTSSQTSGTWNSYDLEFANCNYAIENVVFEKAIAFTSGEGKKISVKNVTINETHDYYAMWISAKGQVIKIDGLTINSAGRGIKIDEQYVSEPVKVTMSVNNLTVKSEKKAAIVVKSVEGADITVSNINIEQVAADPVFAVWVDADSKEYADKVSVNGAYVRVEDENPTFNGKEWIVVTNTDELNNALNSNEDIVVVLAKGEFGTIVAKSNKTIIGSANAKVDCVNLNGADNVTLKGIIFDAAKAQPCADFKGTYRMYANIMTGIYGHEQVKKGAHNLVIEGCTFSGAFKEGKPGASIAFADYYRNSGFSGNITIKGCIFNNVQTYGGYDIYGYYVGDGTNGHGDFVVENNTFKTSFPNGQPIYLGKYASSTPVVVKNNTFETVSSLENAVYVQDHSNYGVSVAAENNTFAK